MAKQKTYKNVLPVAEAGYSGGGPELEAYLKETYGEEYGEDYNFNVSDENDRLYFFLPERLDRDDLTDIANEVKNRIEAAKSAEAAAGLSTASGSCIVQETR